MGGGLPDRLILRVKTLLQELANLAVVGGGGVSSQSARNVD